MKRFLLATLAVSCLSACVQEPVAVGKVDPSAGARDRVAIAVEHIRNGDDERAQLQLKRALDLDPRSPEAHNLMGFLYERDGNKRAAEKAYKKAVKLRPTYATGHYNYARFLFSNGRYKEAYKHYEQATQDLSYDLRPQSFEGMGRSALALGKKDEARQAFMRALKSNPELPLSLLEMAEMQFARNDLNSARDLYQRYLKVTEKIPQTAQSLWLGIRLERHFGNKDALASYELALKRLYPKSEEFKRYQETLKP